MIHVFLAYRLGCLAFSVFFEARTEFNKTLFLFFRLQLLMGMLKM